MCLQGPLSWPEETKVGRPRKGKEEERIPSGMETPHRYPEPHPATSGGRLGLRTAGFALSLPTD